MTVAWLVVVAVLPTGVATAQEDAGDDEVVEEIVSYGDAELIETLRTYGLLDEWVAASPVSPQASLLLVSGNGSYQTQRQVFLDSIEAWADRTERVRTELARIDAAQADADQMHSIITRVWDALVFDDRLAADSKTLVEIDAALAQLDTVEIAEGPSSDSLGELENPITQAEVQLNDLRAAVGAEVVALNGKEPAFASSGVAAFVGFDQLRLGLNDVDQLIGRARDQIKPAREQSERLVASALAQIPTLHASRMTGSTDVGGMSVVTVDAYVRAASRASCSVDWALLAGIGKIESNHGRLGGASVGSSGQVSTAILGPLLDGGATERGLVEEPPRAVSEALEVARLTAQAAFENSWWGLYRAPDADAEPGDLGNGFAVVVDTDDGRLDGNDQWDRAIGPMQFIPETWSKWATDGNGNGAADPHNLYDAAASAARFLCNLSATRGSSPSTYVLGYNASTSYVRSVLATARELRSRPLPTV